MQACQIFVSEYRSNGKEKHYRYVENIYTHIHIHTGYIEANRIKNNSFMDFLSVQASLPEAGG